MPHPDIPELTGDAKDKAILQLQAQVNQLKATGRALRRRMVILLMQGGTPGSTGADTFECQVPYVQGDQSIRWVIHRIYLRVQTAGGAPSVTVERSTGTGAFSATTVGTVTLGSSAYYAQTLRSSLSSDYLTSGDFIRANVQTVGTATGWTLAVECEAQMLL